MCLMYPYTCVQGQGAFQMSEFHSLISFNRLFTHFIPLNFKFKRTLKCLLENILNHFLKGITLRTANIKSVLIHLSSFGLCQLDLFTLHDCEEFCEISCIEGLPWWFRGKESTCQCSNVGLIPRSEISPGERKGNPLQYSCLGDPMDG